MRGRDPGRRHVEAVEVLVSPGHRAGAAARCRGSGRGVARGRRRTPPAEYVPVGVCLSGGLDSTAIICAMARNRGVRDGGQAAPPLLAFCYHDAAFDERAFIADTLSQTGA